MNNFSINPISKFRGQPPTFQQPKEVGFFSFDEQRGLHHDNRQLRYYHGKNLQGANLSEGFESFQEKPQEKDEHLDPLLQSILKLQEDSKVQDLTDFVTWRGVITMIFCTLYNRNEPWELAGTLYKGSIYLDKLDTLHEKKKRERETERDKLMCYWGFKFEQLATFHSKQPPTQEEEKQKNQEPVNNYQAFCTTSKTKLGNHSIIFGAEVDCTDPRSPTSSDAYIELKTSRIVDNPKSEHSFQKFKLLKFWAQSFIGNVPNVVVGFRDDNGIIQYVKTFQTLKIPSEVKEKNLWDANVCIFFTNKFLTWLRSVILIDDPKVSYHICYKERGDEITIEGVGDKLAFLPEWNLKEIYKKIEERIIQ